MTPNDWKQRVLHHIRDQLRFEDFQITPDSCFITDLGADLGDIEQILDVVGWEFGFEFPATERNELSRGCDVTTLINAVENKLHNTSSP